jgi:hypothetical protein
MDFSEMKRTASGRPYKTYSIRLVWGATGIAGHANLSGLIKHRRSRTIDFSSIPNPHYLNANPCVLNVGNNAVIADSVFPVVAQR